MAFVRARLILVGIAIAVVSGCGARAGLDVAAASAGAGGDIGEGATSGSGGNVGIGVTGTGGAIGDGGAGGVASVSSVSSVSSSSASSSASSGSGGNGGSEKSRVVGISAGGLHTCAWTADGDARCWGANFYGQLGDGSFHDGTTAQPIEDLGAKVSSISAGGGHTCALTSEGGVFCWGYDDDGELGSGSIASSRCTSNANAYPCSLVPLPVAGLSSGIAAVSAGFNHTCALTTAGAVLCWGNNEVGELGDGTTTSRDTPVAVPSLTFGVAAISAGRYSTCALLTTGLVVCWGLDSDGELGDGDFHPGDACGVNQCSLLPVLAKGISGVTSLSASTFHTCAVTTDGVVWCWGRNDDGEVGDGSTFARREPVPISIAIASKWGAAVSAGDEYTCAVTFERGAVCWGANFYGELGDGTMTSSTVPVLSSATSVAVLSSGGDHACALSDAGVVTCWGFNSEGQLGDGGASHAVCEGADCSPTPVEVKGL